MKKSAYALFFVAFSQKKDNACTFLDKATLFCYNNKSDVLSRVS